MDPAGIFTVKEESKNRPLILISAGIGITPLLSMFIMRRSLKIENNIYFVQAVQNSLMHPFKNDIDNICKYKNLRNTVFYSNPLETDKEGIDYDFTGYVNKEWIRNNFTFRW